MIGRNALMNPKATHTTKIPTPNPIPVFLTSDLLSSVIISHLGSPMPKFAVWPLYASIFGRCHLFLRVGVQMPFELMADLAQRLNLYLRNRLRGFEIWWMSSNKDLKTIVVINNHLNYGERIQQISELSKKRKCLISVEWMCIDFGKIISKL